MRAISAMRPDIFVAICDGEAPKGASNKRLSRSVSKTLEFLDVCIEKKAQDPGLRDTKLFAAIEVGDYHYCILMAHSKHKINDKDIKL